MSFKEELSRKCIWNLRREDDYDKHVVFGIPKASRYLWFQSSSVQQELCIGCVGKINNTTQKRNFEKMLENIVLREASCDKRLMENQFRPLKRMPLEIQEPERIMRGASC